MKSLRIQQVVRRAFYLVSVPLLAGALLVAQQPDYAPPGGSQATGPAPAAGPAQPLLPQQLDTLVAPVALYPDNLLGQILAASTYPLEIAEAAQWVQQNPNLQGQDLVNAARQQNWDPSVQALVVFPDVLSRLASDIRWTTDLGNAFLAQQADVMTAVQRMRARAQASGKLRSNQQETVTMNSEGDQSAIDIQPANPDVVYVPYYNPEYIWGPPAYGYYPPWDYADIGFGYGYGFGPGIYIGGFFGGLGWGGWGWGCNWFGRSVFLNGGFFNHYGFGGRGFHGGVWAHNPGHRLGVGYPNGGLNRRFGAASAASARASFAGSRYNSGARVGQAGGWNRFGQTGNTTRGIGGQNAYRGSQSYGGNYSNRGASGVRSAPSYGNAYRGGSNAYRGSLGGNGGYRSTPSYHSYAAPSYRSNGGGGVYARPGGSVHSYGGSSHSSGGGFHSSGGGGGFHSSGGGGGFHSSGGGGGFHGGGGGGGGFHGGGGGGHGGGHR